MTYKKLEILIQVLKKIKLSGPPQKRLVILNVLSELENTKTIYDSLKKTYETDEFIAMEQNKYNFVKKYESEIGVRIYGITVSEADVNIVLEYINEMNMTKIYKEYEEFVNFSETALVPVSLIKIEDVPDDIFENLEPNEIEILSEIIS